MVSGSSDLVSSYSDFIPIETGLGNAGNRNCRFGIPQSETIGITGKVLNVKLARYNTSWEHAGHEGANIRMTVMLRSLCSGK